MTTKISEVHINRMNADRELINVVLEANRLGLEGKKITKLSTAEDGVTDRIKFKLAYEDTNVGQDPDTVGSALRGMM